MGLSCGCFEDGEGWWYVIDYGADFKPLSSSRRKRCCSCKTLIGIGEPCLDFSRFRAPKSDVEERICGDEVPLADWYLCESCGEIYLNLEAIGYCYILGDDLRENLKEYWELTGFKPRAEVA